MYKVTIIDLDNSNVELEVETSCIRVYYAHPYRSSERGNNENQNGFIRRFIPKGIPISSFSDKYLSDVQNFINSYPRAIFNGSKSAKMFLAQSCKNYIFPTFC